MVLDLYRAVSDGDTQGLPSGIDLRDRLECHRIDPGHQARRRGRSTRQLPPGLPRGFRNRASEPTIAVAPMVLVAESMRANLTRAGEDPERRAIGRGHFGLWDRAPSRPA